MKAGGLLTPILISLLASPGFAQGAGEVPANGTPLGLEADLTQAFVSFYRENPSDLISKETSEALEVGDLPIRLVPVQERMIGAVYDQRERAVLINLNYLASRYAAQPVDAANRDLVVTGIRATWERSPESLKRFVEDMAPLMIHEVRHALYAQRLGQHPSSMEEEMACHAYESLFLRRRLKRDPEYLGFRQFDDLMRKYLKEPSAGSQPWWRDPFPFSPIADIAAAVETVYEKFPGRFKLNPLLWLHLRSLSEGFAHYRLVFVSTYPQQKYSLETDPKDILKELSREEARHDAVLPHGRQVPAETKRPEMPEESEIHKIAVRFWSAPERVRKAREMFREEWPKLEQLIQEENRSS